MSTRRIPIGKELFVNLEHLLREGEHVALLGPRHGGKGLVIGELFRRAGEIERQRAPRIATLSWDRFRHKDERHFLERMAELIQVPFRYSERERLAITLEDLFLEALGNPPRPLWIFVQDILGFPNQIARELLTAFQFCRQSERFQRMLGVVVTGSSDFSHLTYGENSPYRHARPFLITGLDESSALGFFCRRRQRQRGQPGSDQGLATVALDDANHEISPEAFDLLLQETGGQPHLIQELVITTARYPYALTREEMAGRWEKHHCERCIENFINVHMEQDYFTRLGLRDIERDPQVFDRLLRVLHEGDGQIALPNETPDVLELTGVVRKDSAGKAVVSCGIWRTFLQARNTRFHQADVYALQGRWEQAWTAYGDSNSPPARFARPVSGADAVRLDVILLRLAGSLVDEISQGPLAVWLRLFRGLQQLLGFQSGGVYNSSSGEPTLCVPACNAGKPNANGYEKAFEFNFSWSGSNALYSLDVTRSVFRSIAKMPLPWPHEVVPVIYLERRGAGQEIDSAEQERLPHIIGRFWHAYQTACRIEQETALRTLSDIREKHDRVVEQLNGLLIKDPFDMGEVVQQTASLLVTLGGYRRVQIALVDGKQERIQAVSSACQPGEPDFAFDTDLSLKSKEPNDNPPNWDIQQKVVQTGQLCVVRDASDPNQTNPTTQKKCAAMRIKALAVVPIRRGKTVLGTIHFERLDQDVPIQAEQNLFQNLADQIGIIFHQAQRLTLLHESLNMVHSKLAILNPKREVVFLSKKAWEEDYKSKSPVHGWIPQPFEYDAHAVFGVFPEAKEGFVKMVWPKLENLRRDRSEQDAHISHYLWQGGEVEGVLYPGPDSCEWVLAAIDDFRLNLKKPFRASARIGYVEKIYDLTDFYELLAALKSWMGAKSPRETAAMILNYFNHKGFRWGRIYLVDGFATQPRQLRSFHEFGFDVDQQRRDFLERKIVMPEDNLNDPLAWHAIKLGREGIYVYSPEELDSSKPLISRVVATSRIQSLPTFIVNYRHPRDSASLSKEDERWIDAPLMVGDRAIGKLSVSMLQDDITLPEKWEMFRYAVLGSATALAAALDAEGRAEVEGERGRIETASRFGHHLGNILPGAIFRLHMAINSFDSPAAMNEHCRVAYHIVQSAMDIVNRMHPDGSAEMLLIEVNFGEAIKEIISHCQLLWPDIRFTLRPDILPDVTIRADLYWLKQVFLELVTNSMSWHPRRQPAITVNCTLKLMNENAPLIIIEYCDDGFGIPTEQKESIFARHYSTRDSGKGLGLYDAWMAINRHRGTIIENGTPGKGARFEITFPTATIE